MLYFCAILCYTIGIDVKGEKMKKDIIDTLNKNNGVMKSRQLEDYGFSRTYISNAVDNGLIVREDRGIYVTKDVLEDEMYMFQLKNSKAIFCNNSSLYLKKPLINMMLQFQLTIILIE